MRPTRPFRPTRSLALHAAGACAVGAWAALLLTIACAPDLIDGPSGPPADGVAVEAPAVVEPPTTPAVCEVLRQEREAVRAMTGVEPACIAPERQPPDGRDAAASGLLVGCDCPVAAP